MVDVGVEGRIVCGELELCTCSHGLPFIARAGPCNAAFRRLGGKPSSEANESSRLGIRLSPAATL